MLCLLMLDENPKVIKLSVTIIAKGLECLLLFSVSSALAHVVVVAVVL